MVNIIIEMLSYFIHPSIILAWIYQLAMDLPVSKYVSLTPRRP